MAVPDWPTPAAGRVPPVRVTRQGVAWWGGTGWWRRHLHHRPPRPPPLSRLQPPSQPLHSLRPVHDLQARGGEGHHQSQWPLTRHSAVPTYCTTPRCPRNIGDASTQESLRELTQSAPRSVARSTLNASVEAHSPPAPCSVPASAVGGARLRPALTDPDPCFAGTTSTDTPPFAPNEKAQRNRPRETGWRRGNAMTADGYRCVNLGGL